MNDYPIAEGVLFRFVCCGCGSQHKTTVPRHGAPFVWRCKTENCGWVLTVQTDPTGVSVGHQAPVAKPPELRLIKGDL